MSNTISNSKQAEVKNREWLKKRVIPLFILLLAIAITVALFVFAQRYPEKVKELENLGYVGVFLVSLITSGTVILPAPGILLLFPAAVTYNPFLVGLVGATGSIIGEITGYMAGYGGRGMVRHGRMYDRVEKWMKRWGSWVIFVFAAFLVFDIAGVVAGALRFPLWKFLLVGWLGKSLKCIALMLAGAWVWEAFVSGRYLTSPISVGVLAALATLALLVLALVIENWTWKRSQ